MNKRSYNPVDMVISLMAAHFAATFVSGYVMIFMALDQPAPSAGVFAVAGLILGVGFVVGLFFSGFAPSSAWMLSVLWSVAFAFGFSATAAYGKPFDPYAQRYFVGYGAPTVASPNFVMLYGWLLSTATSGLLTAALLAPGLSSRSCWAARSLRLPSV